MCIQISGEWVASSVARIGTFSFRDCDHNYYNHYYYYLYNLDFQAAHTGLTATTGPL